jgi:hypothetical protein
MKKAISIKQPWANYIAQGIKLIEIRSWTTKYRGDIIICASKLPVDGYKIIGYDNEKSIITNYKDYEESVHLGKAICIAELYDITKMKRKDAKRALVKYNSDMYSWHLRNIRDIDPFDVKGKLGLFNLETNDLS